MQEAQEWIPCTARTRYGSPALHEQGNFSIAPVSYLYFQLTTQLLLRGPPLNTEPEVQGLPKAQVLKKQ